MKDFKPMLAVDAEDIEKLKYPLYASPKLDGVRAGVQGETNALLSRKLKKIPNHHCRKLFEQAFLNELDGELIVGAPYAKDVYNKTVSGVMTREGEPEVCFCVFDWVAPDLPYDKRYAYCKGLIDNLPIEFRQIVKLVEQKIIYSAEELRVYEQECIDAGYEGIMVRAIDGHYKFGRSTLKEGLLLKVKRFSDIEATIIGVTERFSNQNEATIDELGYTKRSSHKENMIPTGMLGSLVCIADGYDLTFEVGTGFTEKDRIDLWEIRESLPKRMIKIKIQPAGEKDRPRFPVYLGFRDPIDM